MGLTMTRVTLVVLFLVVKAVWADSAFETYNRTCRMCHANGVGGAPKTGDVEAWRPRLEKGMESLIKASKRGLNGMPPKGMCYECTDKDYEALISYMSTSLSGDFEGK